MSDQRELFKIGGQGILTPQDLEELKGARRRVAELMADGLWHDGLSILDVGGTEGLRRLRELRELQGVLVERRRVSERRVWQYRLLRKGGR